MLEKNRRILVVDEDEASLEAFKRLFRQRKPKWEILTQPPIDLQNNLFVVQNVDAVICNASHEESSWLNFFKEIKRVSPSTCRIIIASTLEEGAALASLGVAHQYLQKPFKTESLFETLERAFNIRDAIGSPAMKDLLGRLENLPSPPHLYLELIQKLNDPECSPKDVGNIISKDPGMAIKVLQVVNSAYFGLYRKVTDPLRAVTILGMDTIKSLALTYGIFKQMSPEKLRMCNLEGFWDHSLCVGNLCKISGLKKCLTNTICQNEAFTAGLIHDVGKLIFADNMPEEYAKISKDSGGPDLLQKEKENLGANHAEVGAYILELWGLPDNLVEAVLWHHGPFEKVKEANPATHVVCLSDLLIRKLEGFNTEELFQDLVNFLELSDTLDELLEWGQKIKEGGKGEGL